MENISKDLNVQSLDGTVVDLFDKWARKDPNRIAAEWQGESLTYSELRHASLHVSRALLSVGIEPGARVPLLTEMSLEMLPVIIGILRVGACYVPIDVVAWSLGRIEAVLLELSSDRMVVTSSCPGLELPPMTVNFQKAWLHSPLVYEYDALCTKLDVVRQSLRIDDLAWIVFTSGTTGKPKGVMILHRGVYAVSVMEHSDDIESSAEKGGRCLLAYSIAFDGCAGVVWTTLAKGGTLALASSTNFPEVSASCDLLSLTPSMLATMDPNGPYDNVRYVFLGGEAPVMDVVRQWIRPNRKVINTYGPSETTVTISFGELSPDEEPPFGKLIPGVKVVLVDESLQECDRGEVMISGPGLAAGYLNNPELTAKKFILWGGERFYRTGDLARRTEDGKLVWAGRADSLVKNRGFLINLETEVEPALQCFDSVRLAVAFVWRDKLVGFVQPSCVDIDELRQSMKARCDLFIIPDIILALDNFPLRANGKIDRDALKTQLEARVDVHQGSLAPDHLASIYETIRLAFSEVLHVPIHQLDRSSSFTRHGGNSLMAIKLAKALQQLGYLISVIQILKLDTIEKLQDSIHDLSSSGLQESDAREVDSNTGEVPVTDVQKLFLNRSVESPKFCALIGITTYTGDPTKTPSANEFHDACVKVLSAHSIFQTRFNLTHFTLSDLGRLNMEWREVSVDEAEFESACAEAEEQAWLDLEQVKAADNEVPYCHLTCISVPGRKALAFISRTHHVLVDVFSSAILSKDIERALAGETIPEGPNFIEFAKFMRQYKQDNIDRAIRIFGSMLEQIPAASVLNFPISLTPPPEQAYDLVRFDSPTDVTKTWLDSSARNLGVTTSTMIYAAWALFLAKSTGRDHLGFSISLSGRTVPWPSAQSVVGPLLCTAPFGLFVPKDISVHEWLAEVHKTTLDVLEFDGLPNALPTSLTSDRRTTTTIVLSFLDVPQVSSAWAYRDKQRHNYLLNWSIFQDGDKVKPVLEVQSRTIDLGWAEEVCGIPGEMLSALANSNGVTLVEDLLK
ncbi:hypothetical protein VTL71DRAFT_8486 [Oculimacula yallundae]|uniref:Carrier domain-containing protein n=1 Tax=Oculimacula yallundae TaxID=86028 RepID=A0ABR4CXX4_9HELO